MTTINSPGELVSLVTDCGFQLERISNIEDCISNKEDASNMIYLLEPQMQNETSTATLIRDGCTRSIRWNNTNKVPIEKWLRENGTLQCVICYDDLEGASTCPVCGSMSCILCLMKSILTQQNIIDILLLRRFEFTHRCSECRTEIAIDLMPLYSRIMRHFASFTLQQQQALICLRNNDQGRNDTNSSGLIQEGDAVLIADEGNTEYYRKMGFVEGHRNDLDGECIWRIRMVVTGDQVNIKECHLMKIESPFDCH